MYTFIIVMSILVSVLLVIIILAQNSKGGGLSSQFGGSGASNFIGVKKTTDLLEKLTWGFAIALLALALSTNFLVTVPQDTPGSSTIQRAQDELPGVDNSTIPPLPTESTDDSEPSELPLESTDEPADSDN